MTIWLGIKLLDPTLFLWDIVTWLIHFQIYLIFLQISCAFLIYRIKTYFSKGFLNLYLKSYA